MTGIYTIINLINNKFYIGSSTEIEKRINTHFSNLNKNKHPNIKLQNSYNKYGKNNFTYKILDIFEDISKQNLLIKEQEWIDKYEPKDLFNLSLITNSGGADCLKKQSLLLDLRGNIIKEFNSLKEIAKFLNFKVQIPTSSINNSSTIRSKYRVVTKEFYNNELELILSWRNYKVNKDKFNHYYKYDINLKKWIVSYNSEIINISDNEEQAIRISKHVCDLINKNLI